MQTPVLPFRVLLKTALLAGVVVLVPLYSALVWAEMGYPARGALKGLCLLLLAALSGSGLWWLIRRTGFRRDGPDSGSEPPPVREPRPPGGRPPALSAAARAEEDHE